ncbi:MAG: FHA domain-containing protein [Chloroflexi bacterium]|nr:MAG: FHA domain-containing protein [Chloroflexota bacterium]
MSDISSGDKTLVGPSMGPKLEVTRGENAGEVFKVKLTTRVGRERDNDVILLDLRSSRHHLEINLTGGEWVLTDLGSANGTLLNGERVTAPAALHSGDRITVGETEMIFRIPGQRDADTAPVAAASGPPSPVPVPRRGAASGAFPAAAQRRMPSRLVWVAGGAVLLLCVLAVIVVTWTTSRFTGGTGSTENIPAATRATATGKTTPATAAAAGNSGNDQSVPGRPAKLALVYEEDFSDSFSGWDDAFDAYTRKVYGNNRYNIEVAASNLVAWGLANRIVADFEIEVEGKLEDGDEANSYGLLFRFEDKENFYRYDISGDGFYLFSKFIDGEWITLVDWTESEFINTSKNATNVLKVSAFGPDITLWVNGQKLTSVSDDSLSRGNFGFFTGTFAEPYSWVSFDNLKMWTRPNEEIVLIPTPTPPGAGAVSQSPIPTPTPLPPTTEPAAEVAESSAGGQSPVATPTAVASPTVQPTPTNTPEPLPEYASRSQTLARGEQQASGKIVFPVFDTERGIYDIYMADAADGDNLTLIQPNASQPALTVDGTEIAYRSWLPDNRGLFARKLTDDPINAWKFDLFFESARPQYSPVNKALMFHSRSGGKEPAIYEVIDGISVVKRREGAPIQGKSLKWSPDGTQFVYNGCIGGSCGIMISNVDSTGPKLLTNNPTDTNPEISPDGSTIVFMSERAGNWEIYRMDMNGDNLEALTSDKSTDGLPTWSPDGSKIAFVSNRDGEWGIWTMNPDGSNKRRQFVIDGQLDGVVKYDPANSFGWVEENIDWIP